MRNGLSYQTQRLYHTEMCGIIFCMSYLPVKAPGRPPKWATVEELQKLIDEYFLSCLAPVMEWIDNPEYDKDGDEIKNEDIAPRIYVHKKDGNGNPIYEQIKPYTISGLALALGTSRATLLDYEKELLESFDEDLRKQFSYAIKGAKQRVEEYLERYMFEGKNQTSSIFVAKNNFGWIDRTERDLTTKGDSLNEKKLEDKANAILGDDQ